MINDPANLHSVKQRAAALSTSPTCTPLSVKGGGGGEKEAAPVSSQGRGLLLMVSQADAASPLSQNSHFHLPKTHPALEPQGYSPGCVHADTVAALPKEPEIVSGLLIFLVPGVTSPGQPEIVHLGCHLTSLPAPLPPVQPLGEALFHAPESELQSPAPSPSC